MASVSVHGSPQIVQVPDGSEYKLHDPFLSSVLDFIRRTLDQLARALRFVVAHTFKCGEIDRRKFFKGKDGAFVDPSSLPSGHDAYFLLKNLLYFADKVYADALDVDSEDLTETVTYLLQTIRNHVAHQSYLGCERNDDIDEKTACTLRKYDTTQKCLDECIELLEWFVNAQFYKTVRAKVRRIQSNMQNMKHVVEDHRRCRLVMEEAKHQALDTRRAKAFLQRLLSDLTVEENAKIRPVTHAVNMILAPRIQRE